MPFCPECGAEVKAGAKFCPNCGTPLSQAGGSPTKPANTEGASAWSRSKPLGALGSAFGLALVVLGGVGLDQPKIGAASVLLILVLFVGVGLVSLGSGYALFMGRGWLEKVRFPTGLCYLLLGILLLIAANVLDAVLGVVSLALAAEMLYYLRPRGSKSAQPPKA